MKLKSKLTRLLDEKGRGSRSRLAEYLDVPRNYVTRWEKYDKYQLPTDRVAEIAQFFGVTTDYLLSDDEAPVSRSIPLIGPASCGVPTEYAGDAMETVPVPESVYSPRAYAVRAEGDSMSPKISHGDIVICDPDADVANGDIVHYTVNGDSGIKILQQTEELLKLIPMNSSHDPIYYRDDEIDPSTLRVSKCVSVISAL